MTVKAIAKEITSVIDWTTGDSINLPRIEAVLTKYISYDPPKDLRDVLGFILQLTNPTHNKSYGSIVAEVREFAHNASITARPMNRGLRGAYVDLERLSLEIARMVQGSDFMSNTDVAEKIILPILKGG